jgi:hypothetical protein
MVVVELDDILAVPAASENDVAGRRQSFEPRPIACTVRVDDDAALPCGQITEQRAVAFTVRSH